MKHWCRYLVTAFNPHSGERVFQGQTNSLNCALITMERQHQLGYEARVNDLLQPCGTSAGQFKIVAELEV